MACPCGPTAYTEIPSGGMQLFGNAIVLLNGTDISSPGNVWQGFESVYHLDGSYNGTTNEVKDQTGHNNGTGDNGSFADFIPTVATGAFYRCNYFDGNDYITLPQDRMPDNSPKTISLRAKVEGKFLERMFYTRGFSDTDNAKAWNIAIGHTSGPRIIVRIQVVGSTNWKTYSLTGATTLAYDCWYHIGVVWNPGVSLKLYLDGVLDGTLLLTETALAPIAANSYIGRQDNNKYTIGYLQELRLSNSARSAAWLAAEYSSLCSTEFYEVEIEDPTYS